MSDEELRRLAEAATPGPWRWSGQVGQYVALTTVGRGVLTVMDFVRLGMQGAQPQFFALPPDAPWGWNGEPKTAMEAAVREQPYRGDIVALDTPNAAYIAAASPTVILDLLDRAASASDEGSLDAAWAEAEAALPSGHTMDLTLENHVDGGRYLAWTMRHTDRAIIRGEGTTPAAALRALAARLRSIPPASEPETGK